MFWQNETCTTDRNWMKYVIKKWMQKTKRDDKVLRTRGNIFCFYLSNTYSVPLSSTLAFDYIHPRLSCSEWNSNNNHYHPGKNAFRVRQSAACIWTMQNNTQKNAPNLGWATPGTAMLNWNKTIFPVGVFFAEKTQPSETKKKQQQPIHSTHTLTECVIVGAKLGSAYSTYIIGSRIKRNQIWMKRGKTAIKYRIWEEKIELEIVKAHGEYNILCCWPHARWIGLSTSLPTLCIPFYRFWTKKKNKKRNECIH